MNSNAPNKRIKTNNEIQAVTETQSNTATNNNPPLYDNFTYNFVNGYTAFARNIVNGIFRPVTNITNNNTETNIVENEQDINILNINTNSTAPVEDEGIRINNVRISTNNTDDIRIVREEFNVQNNVVNNNENSEIEDSFVRFQLSFFYPVVNQEYIYDFYLDQTNNENRTVNESFEAVLAYFQNFIYDKQNKTITKEQLKKIKVIKYKKQNNSEECGICMDEYKVNERLRLLNCEHMFHCKCVDKWLLTQSNQCPICRKEVLVDVDKKTE